MTAGGFLVEIDVTGLDGQGPALEHGVAAIHHEVDDHLLELHGVRAHRPQLGLEGRDQLEVLADDPSQHARHAHHDAVEVEDLGLEELLATSDIISLHTTLGPDTRNLVNAQRLRMMKRGVNGIISVSMGPPGNLAAVFS